MKKLLLSAMVCLCALTCQAYETTKCYLAHDGAMTVYDASQLTTAIAAAVQGDTIYLQEGTYTGFTLDKEITLRGVGDGKTIISSAVTIAIAGFPQLKQTLLEGLSINAAITLNKAMTGVKIKQCNFSNITVSADNDSIEIDRCWIKGYLYQSSAIKGLTVRNSKIYGIAASSTYTTDACKYLNCNIYTLYNPVSNTTYINGHFINSIINRASYSYTNYSFYLSNCVITNCLFLFDYTAKMSTGNVTQNNKVSTTYSLDTNCDLIDYTYDDLYEKGYKGNDDTVVGCMGGSAPFTLSLPIPKITSSDIYYDKDAQILEVTIQATAK